MCTNGLKLKKTTITILKAAPRIVNEGSLRILTCRKYQHMKNKKNVARGIAIGIAIGTAIGIATDNTGVWLALGIAMGAGIGSGFDKKSNTKDDDTP